MPSPRGNHTRAAQARHQAGLDDLCLAAAVEAVVTGVPRSYNCSEIARAMGVTPWAVHLIEVRALKRLRVLCRRIRREIDRELSC